MYLLGGAVEYLGPVNLDISLISLHSLKRYIWLVAYDLSDLTKLLNKPL